MLRKLGIFAAGAAVALVGLGAPAQADPELEESSGKGVAVATVTGTVEPIDTECSFLDPDGPGGLYDGLGKLMGFDEVAMLGLFIDDELDAFAGVIRAPSVIVACVDGGMTVDDDIPLVAKGAIALSVTDVDTNTAPNPDPGGKGSFSDDPPNVGTVEGQVTRGTFTTVGVVAFVEFNIVYDVDDNGDDTVAKCVGVIGVAPLTLVGGPQNPIAGEIACD